MRLLTGIPVLRSMIAAALCVTLCGEVLPLSAAAPRPVAVVPVDRASLMVQRFTFGPRPGDVAKVRAMGVEAWFERQLAPERVNDDDLETRLRAYPALTMSQPERIQRYPTPGQIRQFAKAGGLPQNPELRAIVSDQVEFYQMRQEAKAQKVASAQGSDADGMMPSVQRRGAGPIGAGANASGDVSVPPVHVPQNLEQSTLAMVPAEVDAVLKLAPTQRYVRLLQMQPEELIALRKGVHGNDGQIGNGMTVQQKETLLALSGTNRMLSTEVVSARLLRDIYSERQLEAVMTDFWLNHFNVFSGKTDLMPSLLPRYQQTVQKYALGHFEDLLKATAQSPAMLLYLDNATSTGPNSAAAGRNAKNLNAKKQNLGLNENYARELMELHTLGVSAGYTQKDVTEVAKVFTGWTMDKPENGGEFVFDARRHEPGPKQVLGQTLQERGQNEGEEVLHMLATSPATAHLLSWELAERFVSDTPPPALVNRMAQTFLQSQGDIKAVLRTMVHAPEFSTPATVHAKLKTPLEYVVSAARVTEANVQNPMPLQQTLQRLGMPLYGCSPPTGYKWDAETWLSSSALVNRMNFSLLLGSNKIGGSTLDVTRLLASATGRIVADEQAGTKLSMSELAGGKSAAAAKERALETVIFNGPASVQTRDAVLFEPDDNAVQQAARDFEAGGVHGKSWNERWKATKSVGNRGAEQSGASGEDKNRAAGMVAGSGSDEVRLGATAHGLARDGGLAAGSERTAGFAPALLAASAVQPRDALVDKQGAVMLGLLLGSPEFQRR